ncbi:Golgi transport complex subunit 6 [Mucor velutinosus]|uniref:Golgi transport complex subunit 6 n=1 Tax=Mucor velutinosus TaxID=708070 RepID=A0AAN7DQQ7_9FUNG|nr:Golgi transport complex subunit 6 [Mucor velutinosus]
MNYQNNNIFNPQSNAEGWNFMDYTSNSQQQSSSEAPLQEPVAFEDFQFSLGLDPEFAMPIPLDISPPPPAMNEGDFYNMEAVPAPMNHAVLDEQDHKAFSQFLDQFFVDPNMQIDPQYTMFDTQHPPPMSLDNHPYQQADEEYHRQSSILQSLDEQKRYYNKDTDMHHHHHQQHGQSYQDRPGAVYLQQSNAITAPFIKTPVLRENASLSKQSSEENDTSHSPGSSHSGGNQGNTSGGGGGGGGAIRRGKPHKELLTEEEKRNNHIASEQKRRSMIRSGFKDLTEIVPTLKNINNSKSTVLFKAVDYIKYLDKRNRNLREKIKNLEVRVEVEGRMGILSSRPSSTATSQPYYKSSSIPAPSTTAVAQPRRVESSAIQHANIHTTTTTTTSTSTTTTSTSTNTSSAAPPTISNKTASAALLQHKTQQKQLMELQEKLQLHQKMLAQQQQQQHQHQHQHQQQKSSVAATDLNRPYHIYDQSHHHHRWHNEKTPDTKMEVDATTAAPPSDSLIKATVSA